MSQGKKSDVPTAQAGIRVPEINLDKLKYIGKVTFGTFTDVVNDYLSEGIAKYEKKNGAITEADIKRVLKK